jgi:hypothetical protein
MSADILIPVHNGESFIFDCINSALKVAQIIDSRVIVSVNCCTDNTVSILSSFNDTRLVILHTDKFLTGGENHQNCLKKSKSEYFILIGADDILNIDGQTKLYEHMNALETKPSVLFGYDEIIDIDNKIRRSHQYSRHWKQLTTGKILRNSFCGRNPNLNGAWIKRKLFDQYNKNFETNLNEIQFIRTSDLYFWNFISFVLLKEGNLPNSFLYIHTPAIFYREYFEFSDQYRRLDNENNANQGRSAFILYCIEKLDSVPNEYLSDCRFGLSVYARNNFINLYKTIGINGVRTLFEILLKNKSLFLFENIWLKSTFNKHLNKTLLFIIFRRQFLKSFILKLAQKMRSLTNVNKNT